MATATTAAVPAPPAVNRPNMVSIGTIVWLSSELMFFAALFAIYFTLRGVSEPEVWAENTDKFLIPFAVFNTTVLVLSSVTCQLGVFAAERGDVKRLRTWYVITFLMGAFFIGGQIFEYTNLVREGLTLGTTYGTAFYLTTGFHGLHVTGGLVAFLFVLGRTYASRRFSHRDATSAIVTSYYWHFVDVVWIALFTVIYIIQ